MENLTATYLLRNVKVPACINIEGFALKPSPENPDNTYLRFHFHHPKKDSHFQSQKEIHIFFLVLSTLYRLDNPEFETITDKSGVRVRAGGRSMKNLLQLKQKDFDKIEKAYKKVKSMTDEDKQIFDFVARWIQKASGSRDAYDKFISYWIAFNFLYGHMRCKRGREIEEWVNTQCDATYASKFFAGFRQNKRDSPECKAIKDLAHADADLDLQRTSEKVKDAFVKLREKIEESKFDVETLRYLVLCIYGVRNSLFHGNWSYLNKTRGHVGGAEFLLYKLIVRGLEKQCNFTY